MRARDVNKSDARRPVLPQRILKTFAARTVLVPTENSRFGPSDCGSFREEQTHRKPVHKIKPSTRKRIVDIRFHGYLVNSLISNVLQRIVSVVIHLIVVLLTLFVLIVEQFNTPQTLQNSFWSLKTNFLKPLYCTLGAKKRTKCQIFTSIKLVYPYILFLSQICFPLESKTFPNTSFVHCWKNLSTK